MLELGRELTTLEGEFMTTACPLWSVKDVYAHLAGISTDILSGNTSEAATVAWADGHVADRKGRSLKDVLDEWATAGPEVSNVMETAGEAFPLELFLDQWTHEWDVRAALGAQAAIVADTGVWEHYRDELMERLANDAATTEMGRLTVEVDGRRFDIGTGAELGEVSFTMFEFARIVMGRRSRRQLAAFEWPDGDLEPHIGVLVRWSVAEIDVDDPVIPTN